MCDATASCPGGTSDDPTSVPRFLLLVGKNQPSPGASGRRVVLPNSVAASQVTINLGDSRPASPLGISIRVGRSCDLDAARELALRVARETVGEAAVLGCLLTRNEATSAMLELRVRAADAAERDALRSRLMTALAQAFAQSGLDPEGPERAAFS